MSFSLNIDNVLVFRHKKIARPFEGSGDVFIVCFLTATGQAKANQTSPIGLAAADSC